MLSLDSRLQTFLTGLSGTSRQQLIELCESAASSLRPVQADPESDHDLPLPDDFADLFEARDQQYLVPRNRPLVPLPAAPRAAQRKGPGGYDFGEAVELPAFTCDVVASPNMDLTRGAAGQQLFAKALLNVKGPKGGLYLFAKQAVLGSKATPTAERQRVLMRIGAKHWPNLEAGKSSVDCYVTFAGERDAICIGALTNMKRVA